MKSKWKTRFAALLCVLAVLLPAAFPPQEARAAGTIYLLAVNDKMCDLPGGLLPVAVNSTIYVPYMVFDKATTGVDLGVYYGLDQSSGTVLTLYSLSGLLTFNLNANTCEDGQGNQMNFRALMRSGVVYVPASAVCNYFGLTYSFLPTTDRGTLIRIRSSSASLDDSRFLSSATLGMTYRYNNILKGQEPQPSPSPASPAASAAPSAAASPAPSPSAGADTREDVRVYLAVDASEADQELLNLFPAGREKILFLFTPDSLPGQAALVRQAVAAGHSVGLIADGPPETVLEQLERGNELLLHIARARSRIVSAPGELTSDLQNQGWVCWRANVTGTTSSALLRGLENQRYEARVELPASAAVISRVLSQLRTDHYNIRQPLETEL